MKGLTEAGTKGGVKRQRQYLRPQTTEQPPAVTAQISNKDTVSKSR